MMQVSCLGPHENEEVFIFKITGVTGQASLDEGKSNVVIYIGKKGHPNGLFLLSGVIEPSFSIDEPSEGSVEVKVKIQRNFGRSRNVTVRKDVLNDYNSR